MINKEELRIGNHISDIYTENLVMRVKSLGKKICTYGVSDFKCSYEKLVPVKITEDALKRCGFEWSIFHQAIHKEDFEFDLNLLHNGEYQFSTFKRQIWIGKKIKYVHELQNFYFTHKGVDLDFFK